MNVLMVEPGKAPYETQIGDDLQSMQALVGGYIQAVYPYEEPVALICNEDGKLDGLPLNRALRDSDGDIYDIIAGNFFIVGLSQNDFTDLPHELAEQFAERFRQPEMFMRVDGRLEGLRDEGCGGCGTAVISGSGDVRGCPLAHLPRPAGWSGSDNAEQTHCAEFLFRG